MLKSALFFDFWVYICILYKSYTSFIYCIKIMMIKQFVRIVSYCSYVWCMILWLYIHISSVQWQVVFSQPKSVQHNFTRPSDLSNMNIRLDASDISTISASQYVDSSLINKRIDKTTNKEFVQTVITQMPSLVTGSQWINKVQFWWTTTAYSSLSTSLSSTIPIAWWTIFLIGDVQKAWVNNFFTANNNWFWFWVDNTTTPYGSWSFWWSSALQWPITNPWSLRIWTLESSTLPNIFRTLRSNGIRVSSIESTASSIPASTTTLQLWVVWVNPATSLWWSIYELISYNTILTSSQRDSIESYLNNKYLWGNNMMTVSYTITNTSSTGVATWTLMDVIPWWLSFVSGSILRVGETTASVFTPISTSVASGTMIQRAVPPLAWWQSLVITYQLSIRDYTKRNALWLSRNTLYQPLYSPWITAQCGIISSVSSQLNPTVWVSLWSICNVGTQSSITIATGSNQWTWTCGTTSPLITEVRCTTPSRSSSMPAQCGSGTNNPSVFAPIDTPPGNLCRVWSLSGNVSIVWQNQRNWICVTPAPSVTQTPCLTPQYIPPSDGTAVCWLAANAVWTPQNPPTQQLCSVWTGVGNIMLTGNNTQWTRQCQTSSPVSQTTCTTLAPNTVPNNTSADLRLQSIQPSILLGLPGQQVRFVVSFSNQWPLVSTSTILDITPPAMFVRWTSSLVPISISWGIYRYQIGTIIPGTTWQLIITGSISSTVTSWQTLSMFAQIYGTTFDAVLNNNYVTSPTITIAWWTGLIPSTWSDPLPILQELVSRYNSIITRNNPPVLMSDVSKSPFLSHIMTMLNNGIMRWYSTSTSARFGPDKPISRWELITVIWRVLNIDQTTNTSSLNYFAPTRFSDVQASSSYARFVNQLDILNILWGFITNKSDGSLLLEPNKNVTQSEVKKMLTELLRLRGFDVGPLQTFPEWWSLVRRWEIAFLMTEIMRSANNVVLGNNARFLDVVQRRLQTMTISERRIFLQRFRDRITTTSPDRMFAIGLYPKWLARDLTDALNGSITSKNWSLSTPYTPGSTSSNDPLTALIEEWSK